MTDAATVYAFVDTNVLLHYRTYDEIDWPSLFDGKPVCLVVTQTVLDELDLFAHDATNGKRRDRSKMLIRHFRKVMPTAEPGSTVNLPGRRGVTIRFLFGSPYLRFYGFNTDTADNRILASLKAFRHDLPQPIRSSVVLVTADIGMQLNAAGNGISFFVMPEDLRLKDEPTPDEKETARLTARLQALENREPRLSLSFGSPTAPSDTLAIELDIVSEPSQAELEALCRDEAVRLGWRGPFPESNSVGAAYRAASRALDSFDGWTAIEVLMLERLQRKPSRDEVRVYAAAVAGHMWATRDYHRRLAQWRTCQGRVRSVSFTLHNTGGATAASVLVRVALPAGVLMGSPAFCGLEPRAPSAPAMLGDVRGPRPETALRASDAVADLALPGQGQAPHASGEDPSVVEWHTQQARHGLGTRLADATLVFPAKEGVWQYPVGYEIHAENVLALARGELMLAVTATRRP
ncbi:MAG: PIN domain-containing protein [Anaerolineae bacterium]